jgi:hypothetical protein
MENVGGVAYMKGINNVPINQKIFATWKKDKNEFGLSLLSIPSLKIDDLYQQGSWTTG